MNLKVPHTGIWQQGKAFADDLHLAESATAMPDDIVWWATALKGGRAVA
jgi:hypothetical protein